MARKKLHVRRREAREALAEQRAINAKLDKEAAERYGRLAVKAGLADLDIPNNQLLAEFETIAKKYKGRDSS